MLLFSGGLGLSTAVFAAWVLYRKDSRLSGKPLGLRELDPVLFRSVTRRLKRRRRDKAIMAQWPTLLEGMAVAVAAGMDILNAFKLCAGKAYGPLRESAEKVIVRLRSGMSLPVALAVMEKEGIDAARRLRATLAQAEVLGTPVSDVLGALSAEYYTLEKQRFESKLNSLPVKLSLITVIFLLPPVLIVSVMPHVLSFIRAGW